MANGFKHCNLNCTISKLLVLLITSLMFASCGGGGGDGDDSDDEGGSTPVDITTRYSVPVDLTKVSYPNSYTTETTSQSDINTDPCNLDIDVITYPKDWIGNFPLPEIKGAPLKAGIVRGMAIKDIMLHDNPAFILDGAPDAPNGCKGDLHKEFTKTIDKLAILGVDSVYLPQWHWALNHSNGSWSFAAAEDIFGPVSDADLTFFTQLAHARGMKVIMQNQIQGVVDDLDSGFSYIPPRTTENLNKWFKAFQAFMAERSVFFESIGIDIWEVGCNTCMYAGYMPETTQEIDLFESEYMKAISNIKTNYTGQLFLFTNSWLSSKPNLLNEIDILGMGIYTQPFTDDQAANLTAESYKTSAIDAGWPGGVSFWDGFGKQIMFTHVIQSRENALTLPGYMEETDCTSSIGDLNVSDTDCIQRETKPDFSLQAIITEAAMELINSQTYSQDPIVLIGDYWVTESVIPQTAYPNIGTTPRNKPAEGILKAWFAR